MTNDMRFAQLRPRPAIGGGFVTSRGDRFAAQQQHTNTIRADDWRYQAR